LLTFSLEKSRLASVGRQERSFNVFYQLLAGATPDVRAQLGLLDDPADYALLSSGVVKLADGPHSNDQIAFEDLKASLRVIGLKHKQIPSVFSVLSAILLLGNIIFDSPARTGDRDVKSSSNESAWVAPASRLHLSTSAQLLGVAVEELEYCLVNRTRYIRKEFCSVFLDAVGAAKQRDSLVSALYSILFAYLVESANAKLSPAAPLPSETLTVAQLDLPGFQTKNPTAVTAASSGSRRSTLLDAHGKDGFDQFCHNYANELLQHWLHRQTFDDNVGLSARVVQDGLSLPPVESIDRSQSRLELLRGGLLGGKNDRKPGGVLGAIAKAASSAKKGKDDRDWLTSVRDRFRTSSALVANGPQLPANSNLFGVNHFAGPVIYDASDFVDADADLIDSEFVALLRSSVDPFVARLFSGPNLAAETHPKDPNTIVTAQVSSLPFRRPMLASTDEPPLEPSEIHAFTTQLNATVSSLFSDFEASNANLWSVVCLRPNDNMAPGKWDAKSVKAQVETLGLGEVVAKSRVEWVADYDFATFAARYSGSGDAAARLGSDAVRAFASELGWEEGRDFAVGNERVWIAYRPWKSVEDQKRAKYLEGKRVELERDGAAAALEGNGSGRPRSRLSRNLGPFVDPADWTKDNDLEDEDEDERRQLAAPRTGDSAGETDGFFDRRRASSGTGVGPFTDKAYVDSPDTPAAHAQSGYFDQLPAQESGDWLGGYDYADGGGKGESMTALTKEGRLGSEFGGLGAGSKEGLASGREVLEEKPSSRQRRIWVFIVYFFTWWIPTLALKYCGRMKRPDVRMAWREKVTICILIFLFCGFIVSVPLFSLLFASSLG
jgi:chitin synthase